MSPHPAKVLAGTAWALSIGLVLGAFVFAILARSYIGVGQPLRLCVLLWLPALLAFPTVGVLVARRLPEHAIGWLFSPQCVPCKHQRASALLESATISSTVYC